MGNPTVKITILAGFSAVVLAGCASWPTSSFAQMSPSLAVQDDAEAVSDGYGYPDYSNIEPAAGQVRQALPQQTAPRAQALPAVATAYPALVDPVMAQRTAALQAELAKMEERLQRVEKAALRLDRRMQLVERNELGRMNTASIDSDGAVQTAAAEEADTVPAALIMPQTTAGYGDGFQPVSTPITSALQAAPRLQTGSAPAPQERQIAANRLPSLADPAATGSQTPTEDDRLAIWTVRYGSEKVWPERDQLPSSRDVVTLLREGGKATLFARGANPNSRAFRERVKALSRYLAKVASLDSVPIATMSAPHLDGDTIEIVASP